MRLRNNPRRFIRSLDLDQVASYDGRHGAWFKGQKIPLNPELVAIIGNKGSGKSAVTDAIGLVGNSHKQFLSKGSGQPEELFSFLNKLKFHKQKCSSNFDASLVWFAGTPDTSTMHGITDIRAKGHRARLFEQSGLLLGCKAERKRGWGAPFPGKGVVFGGVLEGVGNRRAV